MLIILTGLPGTGKSTVAGALARELGAAVLSTDKIRAEKRGGPGFSRAEKGGVYERLFARAERGLRDGQSLVLDGTFYLRRLREAGAAVGRRAGVPVFIVEVISSVAVVKRRMERRSRRDPRAPAGGLRGPSLHPEVVRARPEPAFHRGYDPPGDLEKGSRPGRERHAGRRERPQARRPAPALTADAAHPDPYQLGPPRRRPCL